MNLKVILIYLLANAVGVLAGYLVYTFVFNQEVDVWNIVGLSVAILFGTFVGRGALKE